MSSELGSEKSDDKAPTPTGFAIRWCEEDYLTNHGDKDLKTFSIILVFTSKFFIIMFYYEIYHQLRDRSIHRKTHDWYYIYWSAQLLVIVGMGLLIDFARHHQKNRIAFQIFYVSLIVDVGLTFFVVITLILIDNQCCKGHHRSEQDPETFKTENAHDTHAASGSISGTTEAEIEPNNTNENSTSDPKSKTTGSGASSKDGTSDPKSKTAGSGASSKDGTSDTTGALVRKDVASDSPVSKTVHPATSSITLEGQVETENAHYTHAASGSISGTTEAEVEPNNTNENSTSDPKSKTTGSGASSKDGTSDPKSKTAGSGASSKDGTSDTTGALVRKDVASDSPVSKTVHPTTSSITLEIQVETASVTNSTLVTLSRRGEAINIEEDIDLIAPPLGCICACLYQFCNWNEPSHVPNEKTSLIHKEDTKRKCSLWRMCQSLWKIFLNGISLFTFLAFLSYLTQAVPSIAISYYLSPTASLIRLGFFELVIIVMLGEGAYLLYLLDKFWWLIHVHCTGSIPEEILEEDNKNEHKDKQCHCKSKADASNSSDFEADDTGKGSNTSGKKVKYIDRYLVDGKSPELIPLPFVRKSRCSLSYKKFHWLFVTTLLQIVAFGFVLYVSWRLLHFILTMIVEQTANGNNKFNDILAILPTIAINGWLLFKKGDVLHILKDAVGEVIKSSMEHREHLKHLKHQ